MKISAKALVLDKRWEQWQDTLKEWQKFSNIPVQTYLCGNGEIIQDKPYDVLDVQDIPMYYEASTVYTSWWSRPNAYNAWRSHHAMLIDFYNSDDDYVLMLEDDIDVPSKQQLNVTESSDSIERLMYRRGMDMLYLGWYGKERMLNPLCPYQSHTVMRTIGCGGFHAVILNKNICHTLLKSPPYGPFDWIAGKYIHPFYNCYALVPCLINQKSGYSYVEGGNLDKVIVNDN